MKIYRNIIVIGLVLLAGLLYSTTGFDRSGITISFNSTGWKGVNAGWQEDECLISPTFTLDYSLNSTNRKTASAPAQYVVAPLINSNFGEQTNNQFVTNDMTATGIAPDKSRADLSELWLTWDTNWIYVAVKGEQRNKWDPVSGSGAGANLMVLFDRTGRGIQDFPNYATWNKGVYTRDFFCDFYYGSWGGDNGAALGGAQLWRYNGSRDAKVTEVSSGAGFKTNDFEVFYNGDVESDTLQRVLLFKVKISSFTNDLTNVSSITMKVLALTVDGNTGTSANCFDFMPNNLAGMSFGKKSVADNFFIIPFTDSNGNVLTNISPKQDAKILYLPGSRLFTTPFVSNFVFVSNTATGATNHRKVFASSFGETINLGIYINTNVNVLNGNINIYNLRGELVANPINGAPWSGSSTASKSFSYAWDGKNLLGENVPMGTYIVVFKGTLESGQIWNNKFYVTVVK